MFVDALGREQRGRAGDYLVEAADGSRSIQRRQIFEDIYVAMGQPEESVAQLKVPGRGALPSPELATKQRQNETHGATRGSAQGIERASEARTNNRGRGSEFPASPRRSMPDHKERASSRPAATA